MSSRTVLVAEDDILIRLMLVDALTEDGYHVVQAGTVLEAIAAVGRNPTFDAMITDVDPHFDPVISEAEAEAVATDPSRVKLHTF